MGLVHYPLEFLVILFLCILEFIWEKVWFLFQVMEQLSFPFRGKRTGDLGISGDQDDHTASPIHRLFCNITLLLLQHEVESIFSPLKSELAS